MADVSTATYKIPRTVMVGKLPLGGDNPVTVQTMLSRNERVDEAALKQKLQSLYALGCDIVRVAVPDMKSLDYLEMLTRLTVMPVVADIHFDYRIALSALDRGISKLRLNPGNLGPEWKTLEVLKKAADRDIPVRVGINGGSLPERLVGIKDRSAAMLQAAEDEINIMERCSFSRAVFSLKASDIETTCRANRLFAARYSYPLHLGVTEAGPIIEGVVKSTLAMAELLKDGIGSTIRVSLTDTEENEVIAGRAILRSLGLSLGTDIVSCPKCGRSTFDTHAFLIEHGNSIRQCGKNIRVAVMGCTVNGPGEAAGADIGITGGGSSTVIFRHGEVVGRFSREEGIRVFFKELETL